MSLATDVNQFMESYYKELEVFKVAEPKIIHMAKLGTHRFDSYEIATIDTPIVQRLKYISQLGPVYNIFPTARHTRFEHTLGVTVMAGKMLNSIAENGFIDLIKGNKSSELVNLRLAAIFHDIGHSPFSHVSETVLEEFPEIRSEAIKLKGKPHEVLGYYILKSGVVRAFLDRLSEIYKLDLNADEISNYILGRTKNPAEHQYLADIINGPFDADKLDYIPRDSEFSGIPLPLGLDRLLLSLALNYIETPYGRIKKLIINEKGIMPLEQLIFAKLNLYAVIYNHQKVRAIDRMIISILRKIKNDNLEVNGISVDSPVDFLKLDDYDLLKAASEDSKIKELCACLKNRRTFKRALVISKDTIDESSSFEFHDLLKLSEHPNDLIGLNEVLVERIGNDCTEYDVAIDLPRTPKLIGTSEGKIIKTGNEFKSLKNLFPHDEWLEEYSIKKWTGHVFANERYRKEANIKVIELLKEQYGIIFNEKATKLAKIT